MSFMFVTPDGVQDAAQALSRIHSSLSEASAAVAAPTTGIVAAGQDEVSIAIASLSAASATSSKVSAPRRRRFTRIHQLDGSRGECLSRHRGGQRLTSADARAERAGVINAPTEALLGRPLIGSGSSGAAGTGQAVAPEVVDR